MILKQDQLSRRIESRYKKRGMLGGDCGERIFIECRFSWMCNVSATIGNGGNVETF
jgi:hypothetical protein